MKRKYKTIRMSQKMFLVINGICIDTTVGYALKMFASTSCRLALEKTLDDIENSRVAGKPCLGISTEHFGQRIQVSLS